SKKCQRTAAACLGPNEAAPSARPEEKTELSHFPQPPGAGRMTMVRGSGADFISFRRLILARTPMAIGASPCELEGVRGQPRHLLAFCISRRDVPRAGTKSAQQRISTYPLVGRKTGMYNTGEQLNVTLPPFIRTPDPSATTAPSRFALHFTRTLRPHMGGVPIMALHVFSHPWEVQRVGDGTVVKITRRDLDVATVSILADELYDLALEASPPTLYLDFGEVSCLSGVVCGKLLALERRVGRAGGGPAPRHPPPPPQGAGPQGQWAGSTLSLPGSGVRRLRNFAHEHLHFNGGESWRLQPGCETNWTSTVSCTRNGITPKPTPPNRWRSVST